MVVRAPEALINVHLIVPPESNPSHWSFCILIVELALVVEGSGPRFSIFEVEVVAMESEGLPVEFICIAGGVVVAKVVGEVVAR